MVSLQKIDTWFSFKVEFSCTVTEPDELVNLNGEHMESRISLNVEGKYFHTPDHQIEQTLEQATQYVVDRVIDHVNTQVKHLESLMSKQRLDGGIQSQSTSANHHQGMGPQELQSDHPVIVDLPRPTYNNKTPKLSMFSGEEILGNLKLVSNDGFLRLGPSSKHTLRPPLRSP